MMSDDPQDRTPGPDPDRPDRPDHKPDGDPDRSKPSGPPREGKPYGNRPQGGRPYGDRPQGGRPQGGRPYGDRPQGGRPQGPDDHRRDAGPRSGGPPPGRRVDYSHRDRQSGPRPQGGSWGRDRGPRQPRGDWDRRDRHVPPRPPLGPAPAEVLGEDEEVVAGRRPVEEAFAARREAKRLLVVPERRAALDQLVLHATTLRIPVVEVEGGTITAVSGFDGHQGVALVVAPRRWATLDEVLALAKSRNEPPFLLALDHLEDPQNVGTLLRSAEACGVHGVIFPTRGAAPISPAAIKTSAGAVEHLLLVPLPDLASGLVELHTRGIRVIGADGDASMTVREADMRGPIVIVTGSEGRGLNAKVRRRVDLMARIPMRGKVASLNASVAGSVFLFEAASQRDLPEADRPPEAEEPIVVDYEATTEVTDPTAEPATEPATEPEPGPGVDAEADAPTQIDAEDLLPEVPPTAPADESA
ncbi:MAG: 23S rRNA (guanosine(2251)-2'-O)-methyltransferase RlmB [Planctomycetota bacterium]|nr:MAG: 23S rRNA (guanosine(2251)-2'-O)-methyltransferase RlmB [Planctomycetota bacterium]